MATLELVQAWVATRLWDMERTCTRALRRLRAASERLSTAICPKKAARSFGLAFEKLIELAGEARITFLG